MKRIAIVTFPGVNILDVAGPAQVFTTASEVARELGRDAEPAYRITLVSSQGGCIETTSGLELATSAAREVGANGLDTILVAGGHGAEAAAADRPLVDWLIDVRPRARRFGSICTGAFLLAGAGMLEGRRVATHWAYCDRLQSSYPDIDVERDAIFLEEDGLWSSAGVTSGMDLALAMVEQDLGRDHALLVARRLVIFLKRSGGQAQFSLPLKAQATDGPLGALMGWVLENPAADLSVDRLADHAAMSPRTLFRLFRAATGSSPAAWVETARIECARRLLEDTDKPVETIALETGLLSERLRRMFARKFGVSPSAYRARFSSSGRGDAGLRAALSK